MRLAQLQEASAAKILEILGADSSKSSYAENLASRGLPTKKSEEYRYADIESALQMDLELVKGEKKDIQQADRIIITDGVVTDAPKAVKIRHIEHMNTKKSHFDTMYDLGHVASKGVLLLEAEGDASFTVHHRITKPNSLVVYRVALNVSANTRVNLYETYESIDAENSLLVYGYDVSIERDAALNMVKNRALGDDGYRIFATHLFEVGKNATLDLATFDFGSASALQTIQAELEERAHIEASHLLYGSQSSKTGTVSKFIHKGEHSTSNQVAKNILDDEARGIFDALIKVEHSAKHTKAHQNSKAILLQKGAYMASKPQLEIYIDELEASHGSTTGQLDEKQLFYLRSRGIQQQEARKMLIQAFANELIDIVENDSIKEDLHRNFDMAFYGESRLECIDTCHGCEDIVLGSIKTPIDNLIKG